MKNPIIGYVVLAGDSSGLYSVANHGSEEERKMLWLGDFTTLFSSRRIANLFLKRTKKYAEKRGFTWPWVSTSSVVAVRRATV